MSATKGTNGTSVLPQETTFREALDARIAELEGYDTELARLRGIRAALNGGVPTPARSTTGSSRPRKQGRKQEFVQVVTDNPGITISEAAKKMGVAPNYLYRIKDQAIKDGSIRVDGSNVFPAEAVAA